ncbi:MAG: metal ABC transporter substrate-binding protein [Clostridia bacterium]
MKKVLLVAILVLIIIFSILLITNVKIKQNIDDGKIKIVVSNFASYDFLRAITKNVEGIELTFLLGPGKQMHSYDPTTQDLINIQKADLFVYVGGESENWANKVVETIDLDKTKVVCISDYVDKLKEEKIDGAEEEHEEEGAFNEHIWTSPTNAIKMVNQLEIAMEQIDQTNNQIYKDNAAEYINQINKVKNEIQNIVDKRVRNRLVFGDKMPMQYFIKEFGLEVSAVFNGCSTETDPSSSTIAYIVKRIKAEKIPVVLYCELNDGKVANIIAKEVGGTVETLQIQTLHNVTKEDFNNGETWVSLMQRNISVLEKALD